MSLRSILFVAGMTVMIVSFGGDLANGKDMAKPKEAEANKPADVKKEEGVKPAVVPQQVNKALPVWLKLKAKKTTYRSANNIFIEAQLWAVQPTTICVNPDVPEAHFVVEVYRLGYGPLEVPPNVVQLDRKDMLHQQKIKLETGKAYKTTFNLKKLVPLPKVFWQTGEYRVQARFYLCKGDDDEMVIPAQGPLHILILE